MSFSAHQLRAKLNLIGGGFLLAALLVSFVLTADALRNSAAFANLYTVLLLVNSVAVVTLALLIAINLRNLLWQVSRGQAGAKLTVRLVSLLVILIIVPVTIVYYFSLEFLNHRLDSWFDIEVEKALKDALKLNQTTLESKRRDALVKTRQVMQLLDSEQGDFSVQLEKLLGISGAEELSLLSSDGQIIAFSSVDTEQLLPNLPNKNVLFRVRQVKEYTIDTEMLSIDSVRIRVMLKLTGPMASQAAWINALYPLDKDLALMNNNIEAAYKAYRERAFLSTPLKQNFTLVLSLILMLSVLSAVWVAFYATRRVIAPLSDLVEGTRAVAAGNYEKQLPITNLDELGFLIQSFNDMTRRVAQARDVARESQSLADRRLNYLEAILTRLSSGVISFNHEHRLLTANPAAGQILDLDAGAFMDCNLAQLAQTQPILQTFCSTISKHIQQNQQDWQEEISLLSPNGRKTLLCRGTELALEREQIGYVIVFDDVTALINAQRNAAWSEVARRLAHEIKNPLTPIQLSAERLRHKCLPTAAPDHADVLDRMTHTIIQQVEALKSMVNEFSAYARPPKLQRHALDLNNLVHEVVDLYPHARQAIYLQLATDIPMLKADKVHLRQVLHNLLKNALEANLNEPHIVISTHYCEDMKIPCVELVVQDQGTGFPVDMLERIFEPYVTTKPKGTGLGLAIVKKIVEEHGGVIRLENASGARVVVRLPVEQG